MYCKFAPQKNAASLSDKSNSSNHVFIREVTRLRPAPFMVYKISIYTLVREVTDAVNWLTDYCVISIHTIVREGTCVADPSAGIYVHFNPHLRTRRDVATLSLYPFLKIFQSTPSYEKGPFCGEMIVTSAGFQSTPSYEKGRVRGNIYHLMRGISIHTFVQEGTATFSIS